MKQVFKADMNLKFSSRPEGLIPNYQYPFKSSNGVEGYVILSSLRELDPLFYRTTVKVFTKNKKMLEDFETYLIIINNSVSGHINSVFHMQDVRNVDMRTQDLLRLIKTEDSLAIKEDIDGEYYLIDETFEKPQIVDSFESMELAEKALKAG